MPSTPVLALLVLIQAAQQDSAVYKNGAYGFHIVVPHDWVQVPDSVLRARTNAMRRMGAPEHDTNYPAAFAHAPVHDWLAPPYLLVQFNEHEPGSPLPTPARMVADLNSLGNVARYDSVHDAVLVAKSVDAGRGIRIRSCAAIKIARRGLVSVMAYTLERDSLQGAAIRDSFLAGLQVDSLP